MSTILTNKIETKSGGLTLDPGAGGSVTVEGNLTGTLSATSVLADGVIATTQATSDNSTKVATTAYVKSVVTAEDLDIAGTTGTGSVDLDSQTLTIAGTANEIETSASGQTITIGLPSTITANVTGNVSGNLTGNVAGNVTGNLTGTVLTAAQANITSVGTLSSLAVSGVLNIKSAPFNIGAISAKDSIYSFDNKNQYIAIGMVADNAIINTDWFSGAGGAIPNLVLQTGNVERMRIDSSGNVGIGTSSNIASNRLMVLMDASTNGTGIGIKAVNNGAGGSQPAVNFYNGSGNNIAQIVADNGTGFLAFNTSSNNAERMRITSGGQVQVGTTLGLGGRMIVGNDATACITSFDSSANGQLQKFFNSAAVQIGSITTGGASTSFNTSSDYRLKENVVPMTGALDRVDALKPSRFNFISNSEKTVDGFLAHEVAEVVPEAITGEKDAVDEKGNPVYQGIDQSKIVPLLVGAIQELKAEIETLKAQING